VPRINEFLSINQTGNKFGALLLTIIALTTRGGDERFTQRSAASAVRQHKRTFSRFGLPTGFQAHFCASKQGSKGFPFLSMAHAT